MRSIFRLMFNKLAPFEKNRFCDVMVQGMSRDAWDELSKTFLVRHVLSYLCGTLYLDPSASLKRIIAFSAGGLFCLSTQALTCCGELKSVLVGSVGTSHACGRCEYESQPQLLEKLATLLAPVVQVDSAGSRWSRLGFYDHLWLRLIKHPLITEAKKVQQAKAEAKQGSIFLTMTLRYLAHSFFIQIKHFSRSSVFAQPVRSKLQQSIQLS